MLLLILIAALIVFGSLYPWNFNFTGYHVNPLEWLPYSWPDEWDVFALRDAAVNLILYFPFGFAAFRALKRRPSPFFSALIAVAAGFALSMAMEILQVYLPSRVSSAWDIVCNTAGTALGALAAWQFHPALADIARRNRRRFASSAALILACWACYHLYPFFPLISMVRLRTEIALLAHPDSVLVTEIFASAAEWFAASLAAEALLGRMRVRWILYFVCFRLAVRPLLITRPLGLEEVVAAALVAILWKVLPATARVHAGLALLVSAVLLREIAPAGLAGIPRDFSWIPFHTLFEYDRQATIAVLFRKTFEYGAIIWLLFRSGLSYSKAGALVASSLAICAIIERYLQRQQLNLTDPLLAALITVALSVAD